MDKFLTVMAFLVLCAVAVAYDRWHTPPPLVTISDSVRAQELPPIPFTGADGKSYDIRQLREKGIILHFWASWCTPCAAEFPPLLRRVAAAHGDLALVAVSIDDDEQKMDLALTRLQRREAATMHNPHVIWLWDKDKDISLKKFDTIRPPESVLIDANRRMTEKIAGDPGWETPAMDEKLKALAAP